MSKLKGYSKAPVYIAEELKESVAIEDFLPSPATIAESLKKQETVPVTMKLKKDTVERYKLSTSRSFRLFWIPTQSTSESTAATVFFGSIRVGHFGWLTKGNVRLKSEHFTDFAGGKP